MVSANQINNQTVFLWNCLKNAQENAGKVDNKAIGQLYNIKPNAIQMRLSRLGKTIEALGELQGGDNVSNDNNDSKNAAFPKVNGKGKGKASGAGTGKGKKRKAEEVNVYEDAKDEEDAQPKPKGKMAKLSPTGVKIEEEDEDTGEYCYGGIADDDEDGVV